MLGVRLRSLRVARDHAPLEIPLPRAAALAVAVGAAVIGGMAAGIAAFVGMVILIYRRRTVGPVFSATTPMDKTMYFFLGLVIALGMWNTIASSIFGLGSEAGHAFNYRENVSLWFRGIFSGNPDPEHMVGIPLGFQLHASRPEPAERARPRFR